MELPRLDDEADDLDAAELVAAAFGDAAPYLSFHDAGTTPAAWCGEAWVDDVGGYAAAHDGLFGLDGDHGWAQSSVGALLWNL